MHNTPTTEQRQEALASYLDGYIDRDQEYWRDDVETCYDPRVFEVEGEEWRVLTLREAYKEAQECAWESVWACRPDWLVRYMPEWLLEEHIDPILGDRCGDATSAIQALIELGKGKGAFVRDALSEDGRGHFLSSYDGEEHKGKCDQGVQFYLYRVH